MGTWVWDGANWSEKLPSAQPPGRQGHILVCDEARAEVVMATGGIRLRDTWVWNGVTWVQRIPSPAPPPRVGHAMAFDGARSQVVVFGGDFPGIKGDSTELGGRSLSDTWLWDGAAWSQSFPANTPYYQGTCGMAYDRARAEVVMFGPQTWTWDGLNWDLRSPAVSPPHRQWCTPAYDAARAQVVMFGGYQGGALLNDTWLWNGSTWTQAAPASSPPARHSYAAAYDSVRGQLVVFGGMGAGGALADTWVWDGSDWLQKTPAHTPPPSYGHVMAFDALRSHIVLFGRTSGTWTWDGSDWTPRSPSDSPPGLLRPAMTYDGVRGEVLLFGGLEFSTVINSTWAWAPAGAPPSTGTIQVTTNLPAATFTVSGPSTYTGSGTAFTQTGVPTGTYGIAFGNINCYSTPTDSPKTLTAEGTISFRGDYLGRGTLTVAVSPTAATAATFSIDPPLPGFPTSAPSGQRVFSQVPAGRYRITFHPLLGWQTPPSVELDVLPCGTTAATGAYTPLTGSGVGLLSVNTNHPGASFTISSIRNSTTGSGLSYGPLPVPAGLYTVTYNHIEGYFTPRPQRLFLGTGGTAAFDGRYRRIILVSFTGRSHAPFGPGPCCRPELECFLAELTGSGVGYPESTWDRAGQGMTTLLVKAKKEVLDHVSGRPDGLHASGFTFYGTNRLGTQNGNACLEPAGATADQLDHMEAERWVRDRQVSADDRIVIVGHSYGGNRARLFVLQLGGLFLGHVLPRLPDLLVTVDPVDWDRCYASLFSAADPGLPCWQDSSSYPVVPPIPALSFYQSWDFRIRGYWLVPTSGYRRSLSHTDIDDEPFVHARILDILRTVTSESRVQPAVASAKREGSQVILEVNLVAQPLEPVEDLRITSATLNGTPLANLPELQGLGGLPVGEARKVAMRFPATAGPAGANVALLINGENRFGQRVAFSGIRVTLP